MRSLLFFALIIGIDLLLKSLKDKKKIEAIRQKKMQELNNKPINIPSSQAKMNSQRENSKSYRDEKVYRDDREGPRDRYDDKYKIMQQNYDANIDNQYNSLYDPNAIKQSEKKMYQEPDIRNYGRDKEVIDLPVPRVSTFKSDVLNGIIFSEILGKPKSLQNK